jgi:DNA polymerase/3'-5' exonuclease PolX
MINIYDSLLSVMGIGPNLAKKLIDSNLKSMDQLNETKYNNMLPNASKIWLKLKPERITHMKAVEIMNYMKPCLKHLDYTIAGSYRRMKPIQKDIDLIFIDSNFDKLLKALNDFKLDFKILVQGPKKMSMLIKVKSNPYVQFDMFLCTKEQYYPFLLYLTGSKNFNKKMRFHAKVNGFKLNQECLKSLKTNKIIKVKSEKDIFDLIGFKYVKPTDRSI